MDIVFLTGYAGAPKCVARIDGKEYVLELEEVVRVLTNTLNKNGYEITKTNRQKYPRLIIK